MNCTPIKITRNYIKLENFFIEIIFYRIKNYISVLVSKYLDYASQKSNSKFCYLLSVKFLTNSNISLLFSSVKQI